MNTEPEKKTLEQLLIEACEPPSAEEEGLINLIDRVMVGTLTHSGFRIYEGGGAGAVRAPRCELPSARPRRPLL